MKSTDLRVRRTKESIVNAFISLRAQKPLEKITVKELAELAYINKATFYTHYHDIYDLEDQLEIETIQTILKNIPHPEHIFTNPKQGTIELTNAFSSQKQLLEILFSGSRQNLLNVRLENAIKEQIYKNSPELKQDLKLEVILTFLIQGNFYGYRNYAQKNYDEVVDLLGNICECIQKNFIYNNYTRQETLK